MMTTATATKSKKEKTFVKTKSSQKCSPLLWYVFEIEQQRRQKGEK